MLPVGEDFQVLYRFSQNRCELGKTRMAPMATSRLSNRSRASSTTRLSPFGPNGNGIRGEDSAKKEKASGFFFEASD